MAQRAVCFSERHYSGVAYGSLRVAFASLPDEVVM